jgi:hypothetical protein
MPNKCRLVIFASDIKYFYSITYSNYREATDASSGGGAEP